MGAPEWRDFEIVPTGTYLGMPLGRATEGEVWAASLAKWRARADELARMQGAFVAMRAR